MSQSRITIEGRLGRDPDLRFSNAGKAYAKFSVAVTERVRQDEEWIDGNTTWFDVTAWNKQAENVAEELRKGDLVLVAGRFKLEYYEGKDGQTRASAAINADSVGKVPTAPKQTYSDETDPPF